MSVEATTGGTYGVVPGLSAPSSGGAGGSPSGSTTDAYYNLLQNDPAYMALRQQISAQQIQDAAARQAATAQALIQFGMIPDFSQLSTLGYSPQAIQMLQADISPQIASLAGRNTAAGLSIEAQLQQQEQQAMLGLRNSLAARGALSSGDDAYRTNLQQQAYAQAQNHALQSLLSAIGGYQQNYLTAQQNEQQQLQQGLQTAEANQLALYPNGIPSTTTTVSPTHVAATPTAVAPAVTHTVTPIPHHLAAGV